MTSTFPVRVRADFPVFERRTAGRPIAFFDAPGGSQVPEQVAYAVAQYLMQHNANTDGEFATSYETNAVIADARKAMADLLNAPSPAEIVFGASMTALTLHLSRSMAREWGPEDEVIVTLLDHQANVEPWRLMAREAGMTVRTIPFDTGTMQLDYDALERAVSLRTRLIAVGAASNAVGTANDLRRVIDLARSVGALTFVDAVHSAPHGVTDVQALGCDFLACSAYKFFGPHVGVLWGRRELLERFNPCKLPPAPDFIPDRWETGTLNHEGLAGVHAAVDWIASLSGDGEGSRREALVRSFDAIHAHEIALFATLDDGLRAITGVTFYGVEKGLPRTPTAAFTVAGRTPAEVARTLGAEGVFVWNGNFYASTVCEVLGLADRGGLVRAGLAPYSTEEDVERLLDGVRRTARG